MMLMVVVMVMIVVMVMVTVLMIVIMMMVVIMVVVMVMIITGFFFHTVHGHLHMGTGDPALHSRLSTHLNARKSQRIHSVDKSLPVLCQFQQGSCQHIARSAHIAFQIQRFQLSVLPVQSEKSSGRLPGAVSDTSVYYFSALLSS